MFSIQNLNIHTDDRVLVKDLSFTMQSGERWVVLGANGSGKSSMLNACAGLPLAGRQVGYSKVIMNGVAATQSQATPAALAPLRSVCPQRLDWNTALSPRQLTRLLGVASDPSRLLDYPAEWLDQALSLRSGGEQQRIAVAIITAQVPNLCFLDEPLTHLDEVQQAQLLTQLHRTGKTMLMVSHHLRLSLGWSTHALLPVGNGEWLAGTVGTVCTATAIASAYNITPEYAQQLLRGQFVFEALL